MDYLGLLVIGVVVGFYLAAFASVSSDRKAVEHGYIKLDGKIYKLESIDKEE